ncbi:hypothetical protein CCP3SC1_720007 [Gammaproteobacteria bacterium]
MSRINRLLTLLSAPFLAGFTLLGHWWARSASARYFLTSGNYPGYLLGGDAAAFCRYHAQRYCQGQGVDVGAGRTPFPGARPVEDRFEENAYHLREPNQSLDYVFSSHCLEHLDRWPEALREWRRVLKPGGVLYLYLPHPACRMWRPTHLPYHVWQPEPDPLAAHLKTLGFEVVEVSLIPDAYLSFHLVARLNHYYDMGNGDDRG